MHLKIDAGQFQRTLKEACSRELVRVEKAVLDGVTEATNGLKEELRDETFTKLGLRVAHAWQGRVYPNKDEKRGPAGFVWSKAPRIIDFWSAARIVTPIGAAFAIPVNPVVKRGGRAMTPVEVEAKFNQELEAVKLGSGNVGLFLDLVRSKSKRRPGFRAPTKGRAAQGRSSEKVLMFVLVRNLRSRKLIDVAGIAVPWGDRTARLIEKKLGAGQ